MATTGTIVPPNNECTLPFKQAVQGTGLPEIGKLSAADVASLSVENLFKLMDLMFMTKFHDADSKAREIVFVRLKDGLLNNANLRDWYNTQVQEVRELCKGITAIDWSDPFAHENYCAAAREIVSQKNPQFMRVHGQITAATQRAYTQIGLPIAGELHSMRLFWAPYGRSDNYPLIKMFGHSADVKKYTHDVANALQTYPPSMINFMEVMGVQVRVGATLNAIDHILAATSRPGRGGKTYGQTVHGVYHTENHSVQMPLYKVPNNTRVRIPEKSRFQLLAHECAHSILTLLQQTQRQTAVKAYKKDLRIQPYGPAQNNRTLGYFLDKDSCGVHKHIEDAHSEAMTEIMGEQLSGLKTDMQTLFPNTSAHIAGILRKLDIQYRAFPDATKFPWGADIAALAPAKKPVGRPRPKVA